MKLKLGKANVKEESEFNENLGDSNEIVKDTSNEVYPLSSLFDSSEGISKIKKEGILIDEDKSEEIKAVMFPCTQCDAVFDRNAHLKR